MGRSFNLRRQLFNSTQGIRDNLDLLNMGLTHNHFLSDEKMDQLKTDIQTVEVSDELRKVQETITVMEATKNLLTSEGKRRRLQAEVIYIKIEAIYYALDIFVCFDLI